MLVTYILLGIIHIGFGDFPKKIVSSCFNNPTKVLTADCGAGYMVRILSSLYGYSAKSRCQYTPGDCMMLDRVTYSCVGRPVCNINLPSGDFGRFISNCSKYSNYFQVQFICVPVAEVHNICTTNETIKAEDGYIQTPNYPLNYIGINMCALRIEVHPTQRLKLHAIDLKLSDTDQCKDNLYIYDKLYGAHTICQKRANEQIFYSDSNNLELRFSSSGGRSRYKGFWLYFEALPRRLKTTATVTANASGRWFEGKRVPDSAPSGRWIGDKWISSTGPNGRNVDGRWIPGFQLSDGEWINAPPYPSDLNTKSITEFFYVDGEWIYTSSSVGNQTGPTSSPWQRRRRDNHPQAMQIIVAIAAVVLGLLLIVLICLLVILVVKRRKEISAAAPSSSAGERASVYAVRDELEFATEREMVGFDSPLNKPDEDTTSSGVHSNSTANCSANGAAARNTKTQTIYF